MTIRSSKRKVFLLLIASMVVTSLVGCIRAMPIGVACSYNALVSVEHPFRWVQGQIWFIENDNVIGTLIQLNPVTGETGRSAVVPATDLARLGYKRVTWTAVDVSPAGQLLLSYVAAPSLTSVERIAGIMIVSDGTLRWVREQASNGVWIDDTTIAFLHQSPPGLFRGVRQSLYVESVAYSAGDELTMVPIRHYGLGRIASFLVDGSNEGIWYETVANDGNEAVEALAYQKRAESITVDLEAFCIQPLQPQQRVQPGQLIFSAEMESYDLFIVDNNSYRAEPLLVSTPNVDETHPAWAPNGEHIGYVATRSAEAENGILDALVQSLMIYSVESDQSYSVAEFEPPSSISWPIWSPDSNQLAFLVHVQEGVSIETNAGIAVFDVPTQSLRYYSP